MIDVFVSYSSDDRDRVGPLVRALEDGGLTVWWDKHIRSGRSYDREIEHALDSARCVVVVWSNRSIDSEWVRTEAAEGLRRDCLVPVRIDDVRPPLAFRRLQTVELTGFTASGDRRQATALTDAIEVVLGGSKNSASSESVDGNRREITYLAARIGGFGALGQRADPEDVEAIQEELTARLTRISELYGGVVNQSSSNRFGVIFGLPNAHEDDPMRAVHLGLALRNELQTFPVGEISQGSRPLLSARTGIDRGVVVAKAGRGDTGLYQLAGACVTNADGLLDLSTDNQVLISEATLQRVAPYFVTRKVDQAVVEGRELSYFEAMDKSGVHTKIDAANAFGFTPHRGRDLELSTLTGAARRALAGRGRTVVLVGDAGIGKSRLARELVRALDASEHRLLIGTCQSFGTRSPYLPILEALEDLLNLHESTEDLEAAVANAALAIDASLESVISLLLHLLSVSPAHYPAPQLEGLALRRALQDAVIATLTMAARSKPVVVLLEDWHWVDTASNEVLQRLIEVSARHPLFVVVTLRPTVSPTWLTHSSVSTIQLEPLEKADTEAFICGLWNVQAVPDDFVKLMQDTTDGNPFFIEEICRSLLEGNQVAVADGEVTFTATINQLQLPSSVQSVIRARLDQLSRPALEILNLASVLGRVFGQKRLQALAPPEINFADVLNELIDAELIQHSQLLPEPEFEFRHVLTQMVVYESLLRPQRRKMHEQVGQVLEHTNIDRPDDEVEMLAYHFARGEDHAKAIEYTLRAGEKAASRSAIQEAASHFTRAAELISETERQQENRRQQLRALVNLGTALMVVKGYGAPEVIDAFRQALDLSKDLDGSREQFSALWGLWRYYYNTARLVEAREAAEKLLHIAASDPDPDFALAAHTALGVVNLFSGRFTAAAHNFTEATSHIGDGDSKGRAVQYGMSTEVMSLSFAAMVEVSQGLTESARESVARAGALAASINHDATLAFAHYYAVAVAGLLGDPQMAGDHVTELKKVARAAEFPHWIALADYQEAMLEAALGSPDAALPKILAAKDKALAMGVGILGPTWAVTATPIFIALNRREEALAELDKAEQAVERGGIHYFTSLITRARGMLVQSNSPEHARRLFEQAAQQADALDQQQFKLRALTDLLNLQLGGDVSVEDVQRLQAALDESPEAARSAQDCARAEHVLQRARESIDA